MASNTKPTSTKERITKIKRDTLRIVEAMLEKNITEQWFLENCVKLCQADYDDVIQERSIELMCGYPICNNTIQRINKKYHIAKNNKVYDITDRKNFCTNRCYKASNYLKTQLHSLPQYMRKNGDTSLTLKLLSDFENFGSAGEELIFLEKINKKEIEVTTVENLVVTTLTSMLQEDVKDCTEHLAGLNIKENVYEEKYVFGEETPENISNDVNENNSESSELDTSDEDDKSLFPDHDNLRVLSNKHMPIPGNTKKAEMIEPLRAVKISTSSGVKLPIDSIDSIFQDWFTEDTMKYLLGVRQVYAIKGDHLFKTLINTDASPEHLNSIKEEYVNVCLKIDKLPEDDDSIEMVLKPELLEPNISHPLQDEKKFMMLETSVAPSTKKTPIRKRSKKSPGKKKSVSFSVDVRPEKENSVNFNDETSTLPEPVLPLVDSVSQNALRKQVLLGKLRSVFMDLLDIVDLHYRDIKQEVKAIVDTFSLTPTNIIHKPKQMKCIGVVLYRLLTKLKRTDLHNDSDFFKICENSLPALNVSQKEVENLVLDLASQKQIIKLQKC